MLTITQAYVAATGGSFDPSASLANIKTLLLSTVALVLILLTIIGLLVARRGNPGKNANIGASTLIALFPLVIAVGIGAAAFGAGVFGWLIPGLSK